MTSLRVLVADDDKMLSQMLCTILREAGHKPTPAFDSVQAMMHAMRQPAPHLVLLDIAMPGGSGLDLLTKLKKSTKTKDIPIIVISGNTETQTPEHARTLGAARFVPKPVDPGTLLQVISEVMEEGGTPS
jgi:DNA-binding response OmpR family regulator